jgi:hypothetical protein
MAAMGIMNSLADFSDVKVLGSYGYNDYEDIFDGVIKVLPAPLADELGGESLIKDAWGEAYAKAVNILPLADIASER